MPKLGRNFVCRCSFSEALNIYLHLILSYNLKELVPLATYILSLNIWSETNHSRRSQASGLTFSKYTTEARITSKGCQRSTCIDKRSRNLFSINHYPFSVILRNSMVPPAFPSLDHSKQHVPGIPLGTRIWFPTSGLSTFPPNAPSKTAFYEVCSPDFFCLQNVFLRSSTYLYSPPQAGRTTTGERERKKRIKRLPNTTDRQRFLTHKNPATPTLKPCSPGTHYPNCKMIHLLDGCVHVYGMDICAEEDSST